MDISVIIVNYRSWDSLRNCLDSIKSIETREYSLEVIVVDNFSDDNYLTDFRKEFSDFKFIENTGNNGFANGCNLGASIARGSFYLFLNPDTHLKEDIFASLLKTYNSNKDLAILSCLQVDEEGNYYKQENTFPSFSCFFGINRALYRIFKKSELKEKFRKKGNLFYPDWVTGSVVFISREWFEKIGGWNEDYWMYLEDVDLCKKSVSKGGKLAVSTDTVIFHKHGGATRKNCETEAIAKSEVVFSKHVYINNHFSGLRRIGLHTFLIMGALSERLFLSLICLLYSPSKSHLNFLILNNLLFYYEHVLEHKSWLSKRSMNYQKA